MLKLTHRHAESLGTRWGLRGRGSGALAVALLWVMSLLLPTPTLSATLVQPDATVAATFIGNGGYSADGTNLSNTIIGVAQVRAAAAGSNYGVLQAEVPADSTVFKAYLYASFYGYHTSGLTPAELAFSMDATAVTLEQIATVNALYTARADVTALVAAKVGSGSGITDFLITADTIDFLDGVALVVIYANASLPMTTIALVDGADTTTTTTFKFAAPLDKTPTTFSAITSLGIGASSQGASVASHGCGAEIDLANSANLSVNGQLVSTCAGHYDEGTLEPRAFITVGGVGDNVTNPTLPNPVADDEFYTLAPLLNQGDRTATIQVAPHTAEGSTPYNAFLNVTAITAQATVHTENCTDGLDNDGDELIDAQDPDCNSAPLAQADTATTPQNTPIILSSLLANDTDADGDVLSVGAVDANSVNGGTIVRGAGNSVIYTPATNFVGSDTFNYTASDNRGGTAQAQVTVTVTRVNRNPIANPDSVTTPHKQALTLSTLLANDTDPDGNPLTLMTVDAQSANGGTVSKGTGNSVTYTPATSFVGTDTFNYTVSDNAGGTAQALVTVTVTNRVPVATTANAFTTNQNTPLTTTSLLANDTDADGDTLTVSAVSPTSKQNGTVKNNNNGTATYNPATGFYGTDTFTYTINDGYGGTAQATVTMTVIQTARGDGSDSGNGGGGNWPMSGLVLLSLLLLRKLWKTHRQSTL